MKNIFFNCFLCMLAMSIVNGCDLISDDATDEEKEYLFSVSPLLLKSNAEGDILKISIMSDTIWIAETNDIWYKISKTAGRGDMEVTVTTESNNTGMQREGSILFRSLDKTEEVKIIQLAVNDDSEQRQPIVFLPEGLEMNKSGIGVFVVNHTEENDGALMQLFGNQVDNEEVIWDGMEWTFKNEVWWKDAETIISAYAYSPFREAEHYDTPEAWELKLMENQTSLYAMEASCSYYGSVSTVKPEYDNVLHIEMKPLNAIFKLNVNYDEDIYELQSVKLKNVFINTKIDLNDGSLSNDYSEKGDILAYIKEEDGKKNANFILFPQMLTTEDIIQIEIKDLREGGNSSPVVHDLRLISDFEIKSACIYSMNCIINTTLEKLIISDVSVKDWVPGEDFIFSFN